eukprot:1140914-Pelagomonas_calceolata.AAC.8
MNVGSASHLYHQDWWDPGVTNRVLYWCEWCDGGRRHAAKRCSNDVSGETVGGVPKWAFGVSAEAAPGPDGCGAVSLAYLNQACRVCAQMKMSVAAGFCASDGEDRGGTGTHHQVDKEECSHGLCASDGQGYGETGTACRVLSYPPCTVLPQKKKGAPVERVLRMAKGMMDVVQNITAPNGERLRIRIVSILYHMHAMEEACICAP